MQDLEYRTSSYLRWYEEDNGRENELEVEKMSTEAWRCLALRVGRRCTVTVYEFD